MQSVTVIILGFFWCKDLVPGLLVGLCVLYAVNGRGSSVTSRHTPSYCTLQPAQFCWPC